MDNFGKPPQDTDDQHKPPHPTGEDKSRHPGESRGSETPSPSTPPDLSADESEEPVIIHDDEIAEAHEMEEGPEPLEITDLPERPAAAPGSQTGLPESGQELLPPPSSTELPVEIPRREEIHRPQRSGHHPRHQNNRHHNQHSSHRPRPFVSESRHKLPEKDAKREILVNCSPEETRVGVVEDDKLIELLIERTESEKIVGNIYKGRVENVLPGISSAFANIGLEKNAYLYVSDVIPTGKRNPSSQIEKMIARNDIVMLQVAKEAIGTKGVKVTMDVSLPGRFLVYMPMAEHLGVSKNIEDRKERDRLRTIVESCAPEKGGVIIRTEAEGAEEQALRREMAYLIRLWDNVQRRYENAPIPSLVHRDLGLVFQTVRDVFTESTSIFLVDSRSEYRDLMDFLDSISPELKSRVKLYEGKTPLFQAFNIESQIEKIRSARVDLPSGGYIIIQEAEGLCAIDVNTGKFTGKRSQEETVTATNVEAAEEVARQLRLRNIGGIIVIDFIDMRHARNRQKVMEALAHYVRDDRAKIKILPITRLGLIEMTRERKRESLFALLGEACPQCHASGRVLSRDSMYIRLKREILMLTHGRPGEHIKLFLSPPVAHYFQERHQRLENVVKHKLTINPDPNLPWEEYRILIE